jgi:hypothetical protein
MTSRVLGFRAGFIPRFGSGGDVDKLRREAEREQQSFWEAVQFGTLALYQGLTVELRYVAHETTREIELWILFDSDNLEADEYERLTTDITHLLPRGYGWTSFRNMDPKHLPTPSFTKPRRWWTARAVRRLVFADVPDASNIELPAPGGVIVDLPSPSRFPDIRDTSLRRVAVGFDDQPSSMLPPGDSRWAIPLIMAIRSGIQQTPTFFERLQIVSPSILSIRFARLPRSRLPVLRSVANHFLQQNLGGLATGIEGAYGREAASYHRYLLPDDLFNILDIGFATSRREDTASLCQLFCSHVGGLTGFNQADISTYDNLSEFGRDIPLTRFFDDFLNERRAYLSDDLEAFDVELPDDGGVVEQFMLDAPYVYTFHEVLSVITLPTADDRGLPGIDSRPLPPFNNPSISYDPVSNVDGAPAPAAAIGDARRHSIRIGTRGKVRLAELGKVRATSAGSSLDAHWHRINPTDLTKHALVVGATGSGKTMVTSFLARELARVEVPFCVIEPVKTEYFDRLSNKVASIRRFNFEGSSTGHRGPNFFVFDPLRLPDGVTVAKHVSYLRAAWQAALPMDIIGSMLLEDGLIKYYTDPGRCGFHRFTRGTSSSYRILTEHDNTRQIAPSFRTFRNYFLREYLPAAFAVTDGNQRGSEFRENAIQFFSRRFALLEGSVLGESMIAAEQSAISSVLSRSPKPLSDNLDDLFNGNSILELDALPDNDDKALVMAFVLIRMYELRQAAALAKREHTHEHSSGASGRSHELEHVLIIEEAHRLLDGSAGSSQRGEFGGVDPKAKAISLFVDMLAEIRAFGQGIVIVEQIPTKIVPEAIKNTNLKVMLRMPSLQDREVLGKSMNLTDEQIRFVATLRANMESGIDFVAFEEQLDQPILLNLPLSNPSETPPTWLFDEFFDIPLDMQS